MNVNKHILPLSKWFMVVADLKQRLPAAIAARDLPCLKKFNYFFWERVLLPFIFVCTDVRTSNIPMWMIKYTKCMEFYEFNIVALHLYLNYWFKIKHSKNYYVPNVGSVSLLCWNTKRETCILGFISRYAVEELALCNGLYIAGLYYGVLLEDVDWTCLQHLEIFRILNQTKDKIRINWYN